MRSLVLIFWIYVLNVSAYVGQWHSYTQKNTITSLQYYSGFVFVGTSGGIRKVSPGNYLEKSYDNLDGLLDVNIVAISVTPANQLWAASKSGFLYLWNNEHWDAYGKSYVSERWQPNLRAMVSVGKYLVIGTGTGLTFFDTEKKYAAVNLTKFADKNNVAILSIINKSDSIFVGTEVGVYKTAIDGSNILSQKYQSIFDPKSWTPVQLLKQVPKPILPSDTSKNSGSDSISRPFNTLAFDGSSLETFSTASVQYTDITVKAVLGMPLEVSGKIFKTITVFDSYAIVGDKIFLGGPYFLGVLTSIAQSTSDSPAFIGLIKQDLPQAQIFNISSDKKNTYAQTRFSLFKLENENWKQVPGFAINSEEYETRGLRNLSIDQDGNALVGTWGTGILKVSPNQLLKWDVNNSPCMDTAIYKYTVIQATSQVYNGLLWGAVFKNEKATNYDLVALNLETGKMSCPILNGNGRTVRHIKALSDTTVAVMSELGIDIYRYSIVSNVEATLWKKIQMDGASESWDIAADKYGKLWCMMAGQLVYVDSVESRTGTLKPKEAPVFNGVDCRQMEADAGQTFWIGCSNGLFHFSPSQNVDASVTKKYSLESGLLSNAISDLSVNKSNGQIWMATDKGISMYEGDSRPIQNDQTSIKIYPNPFRETHRYVIVDNIPAGMGVHIFSQSGNVVKYFKSESIKGGQCQWDGLNSSNAKVTPGIYNISVDGSGKTQQGKIIVAR